MLMIALLIQAVTPPTPADPATMAVARQVAAAGTFGTLLPLMVAKETEDLVAAHPELDPAGQAGLRRTASRIASTTQARLFEVEAGVLAERLTRAELDAVLAFYRSPAAARLRTAQPAMIAAVMAAMGGVDFKRDVIAAYCAEPGRTCPR